MPIIKLYDIVTNDKWEYPVKYNLVGAKQVAKYLGITENMVRQCLCRGRFNGKYKAIEVGVRVLSDKQKKRKQRAYNARQYRRRKELQNA
jgi:DNA-binding transcriptional regulator PaaX